MASYRLDGRDIAPGYPSEELALWTINLVGKWQYGIYILLKVQIHTGLIHIFTMAVKL